jgi:hypothetical protein
MYRVYKLQLHLLHSDKSPARSAVFSLVLKKSLTQWVLKLFCATDIFYSLVKHLDPLSQQRKNVFKSIKQSY